MSAVALPLLVATDSLAVLAPLLSSVQGIRAQLPPRSSVRLGRQLDAQAAALGARVDALRTATHKPRAASSAPVPVDPAGMRATMSWLANLLRRAVDLLTLDPTSKAVVVRALGQIELATIDLDGRPA